MSTETLTAQEILINVRSSQGKPKLKISVPVTFLWEDLKARLTKEGYNMDSLEAVNNINNLSFNHPKGKLPDVDFNLHMFPKQTKGGMGLSRSELYNKVKGYMATGPKGVEFFNEGQNFTRKSSADLEALVAKWEKKHGTAIGNITAADKKSKATVKPSQQAAITPKVKKERVKANVADVVASVAEAKAAPCPELTYTIEGSRDFLKGITGHENQEQITIATKALDKALTPKPTKTEDEILAEEEAFFKSGLTGIKKY